MKNGEDVSEETGELIANLDEAFFRIEELFEEITAIKNGTFVSDEMDWDEEYAEEYDVDVAEIIEEAKAFEENEEGEDEIEVEFIVAEEESPEALKAQAFDINID